MSKLKIDYYSMYTTIEIEGVLKIVITKEDGQVKISTLEIHEELTEPEKRLVEYVQKNADDIWYNTCYETYLQYIMLGIEKIPPIKIPTMRLEASSL